MTNQRRARKLEFAMAAHQVKPDIPVSWMWLLEWAARQEFLFPKVPK